MNIDELGLSTTVVGSFPLQNTQINMERAIEDQINIGIDFPCYPQLVSMISQFLTPLSQLIPELEQKDGKFILTDDFKIPDEPIALEYGEFVLNYLQNHPNSYDMISGTKACLTGPFTLASEITLQGNISEGLKTMLFKEPKAIMVDWIVEKFSKIMKNIGKAYNDMGFNIISMDEPILGLIVGRKVMFHSRDFVIETLNRAISEIKDVSSIHVCGQLNPNLRDILLDTEVNILDHEFQSNTSNYDIFKKTHFKEVDKYLGFGALETKIKPKRDGTLSDYVESISTIQKTIQKGIDIVGRENLIVKPDCGFQPLRDSFEENFAYEIVIRKLNNMILALKSFE
ncbi:MAG: putative methylcobalamin:homocysteine methyltransferase [Promethearchaeota archaeon]|nr:MAG: putative methylcobalamin:homocysteine methyltransferase [Candidatus Lokiarchaeota archaeon]